MSLCPDDLPPELKPVAERFAQELFDEYRKELRQIVFQFAANRRAVGDHIVLALHLNKVKIMGKALEALAKEFLAEAL